MKKFKFLVSNSLLRKLKSKGFIIAQIITSVLILAIMIVPSIFLGSHEEAELPVYNILLIDETTDNKDLEGYLTLYTKEAFELNFTKKNVDYESDINSFYNETTYELIVHYQAGTTTELIDVKGVNFYSKLNSNDNLLLSNIIASTKFVVLDLDYSIKIEQIKDPSISNPDDEGGFNL